MSRIKAGIFGQVVGKTGGIVFSKARGKDGVINTTRILTPPSNPRTANQQLQRGKFAESVRLLQSIGSTFYSKNFNRAVGQLPGYQSWMNRSLVFRDENNNFIEGPTIKFSSRPPITITAFTEDGPTQLVLEWSPTVPAGGSALDILEIVVYPTDPNLVSQDTVKTVTKTRQDDSASINVPDSTIGYMAVGVSWTIGQEVRLEIQNKKKDA